MSHSLITWPDSTTHSVPDEEFVERPRCACQSKPTYRVEVAATPADMESHRSAWESLVEHASEPNVWYEPWMFFPAVEAFGRNVRLHVAFVYRNSSEASRRPQLCGVFPWELTRYSPWCPCLVLRMWRHQLCFLGAPLIHRDHLRPVWDAILNWSANFRPRPWWLDLSHQPVQSPLYQSLNDSARHAGKPVGVIETVERACLLHHETLEEYSRSAMSTHFRQELRRKRRRLAEQGRLELRVLNRGDSIDEWIDDFLELEARGWKGREATALRSSPEERTYFQQIARAAFARQQLQLLGLYLDGRPVAMKCNLLAAPGSFSFKIAFDESLAKLSPGVLLEHDNLEQFFAQSDVEWMDSCAKPGHFMIGQLWKDRRLLHRVLVANCRRGELALRIRPMWRDVRGFCLREGVR